MLRPKIKEGDKRSRKRETLNLLTHVEEEKIMLDLKKNIYPGADSLKSNSQNHIHVEST